MSTAFTLLFAPGSIVLPGAWSALSQWGMTFTMNAGSVLPDDAEAEGTLKDLREKPG